MSSTFFTSSTTFGDMKIDWSKSSVHRKGSNAHTNAMTSDL